MQSQKRLLRTSLYISTNPRVTLYVKDPSTYIYIYIYPSLCNIYIYTHVFVFFALLGVCARASKLASVEAFHYRHCYRAMTATMLISAVMVMILAIIESLV